MFFVFGAVKIVAFSEQKELIGRFYRRVFGSSAKADDAFVLLVGEEQDVDIATLG